MLTVSDSELLALPSLHPILVPHACKQHQRLQEPGQRQPGAGSRAAGRMEPDGGGSSSSSSSQQPQAQPQQGVPTAGGGSTHVKQGQQQAQHQQQQQQQQQDLHNLEVAQLQEQLARQHGLAQQPPPQQPQQQQQQQHTEAPPHLAHPAPSPPRQPQPQPQPQPGDAAGGSSSSSSGGVDDGKVQALEALNNAFCRHIYSTALAYLRQQYSDEDLQQQFMDILDADDPYDQPCTVAHQHGNSSKNRYRDVVPYDHNRVCLPPLQELQRQHYQQPAQAQRQAQQQQQQQQQQQRMPGGAADPQGAAAVAAAAAAAATRATGRTSSSSSGGSYINASFMSDPALTGDQAALQGYIGTQGPLPSTVADFWRMVAFTNTSAIVMLTGLCDGSPTLGNSRPRCAVYFPEQEHDVLRLPGASVTCVHRNNLDENVHFRQLEVVVSEPGAAAVAAAGMWSGAAQPAGAAAGSNSSGGGGGGAQQPSAPSHTQPPQQPQPQPQQQQQRLWINHYEYSGWPDYGVPPSTASVLALCHALDGCRRAGCKIVVHCSAGVGRTGTFIAVDVLLQRLHSLSLQLHGAVSDADIIAAMGVPELVMQLRRQRRGTVQTWEQYSFIWQAVMDELETLLQQQQQQQPNALQQQQQQQQQEVGGLTGGAGRAQAP